jgi:hypothetical protein
MLTGNKGEWSEAYVLIKLLAEGKLYAADENLQKIDDVFYPILKIVREEIDGNRDYILNGKIKVVDADSKELLTSVPVETVLRKSIEFFGELKNAKGRSFSLPNQEDFLNKLYVSSFKAKSKDKSDITLVVHDLKTGKKPTFGFSIKSLVGKKSTLFNPSVGTNFIFKITTQGSAIDADSFNERTYNEALLNKTAKISHRLNELDELGADVELSHIQSETLHLNLTLIDSSLHLIVGKMLYYKYRFGISKLSDLVDKLNEENPLLFNLISGHPFYEYKLKNLLTDSALGMTTETVWTGNYDATGGIILVRNDGEILCYHIYNKNEFQDYLLNNTKLEQASTSEDKERPGHPSLSKTAKPFKFGWIYREEGETFIKLNLQIRFTN